jgi:hypothetical protein
LLWCLRRSPALFIDIKKALLAKGCAAGIGSKFHIGWAIFSGDAALAF